MSFSTMVVLGLLVLALAGIGIWMWAYRRFAASPSSAGDRYGAEPLYTPDQVQMLDYLRATFPGQVVMLNVRLSDMLSVRKSEAPERAMQRLGNQKIDFVVCGADGRATFAFDVERYHVSDAEGHAEAVNLKNRILKTAGVRLVFLKNTIKRMPAPDALRAQLNLVARPRPREEQTRRNTREALEAKLSQFESRYNSSQSAEMDDEVASLSGLMALNDPLQPAARRATTKIR